MANLKALRNRINSVKSTRKITSAMKMVAASKLRRAQMHVEAARPYAVALKKMLSNLMESMPQGGNGPKLMVGTGKDDVQLVVVVSSDRGLCGGFNANLTRQVRLQIRELKRSGKTVKLMTIGRKAYQLLSGEFRSDIIERFSDLGKEIHYETVAKIGEKILALYANAEFDQCHFIYNEYISVISQEVKSQQVIPVSLDEPQAENQNRSETERGNAAKATFEFEPDEETLLEELLPKNFLIQLFQAVLESAASEQGARMTAMDNATRNAGDMINNLTISYNRQRQAVITSELIEIISGAEAV